jgi:trehalose 6-phosphate phosphatase
MQVLLAAGHPDHFFAQLARAPRAALLLDYDGTLAPFHVDPARALPYPGITAALDGLMQATDTHVMIVSGRRARDLVPLLGLRHIPEIWGSHGWERRFPDGRTEIAPQAEPALRALAEAERWIGQVHAIGGRSEVKPACLAVHWRGLDPVAAARISELVTQNWARQARETGLELHRFEGGIELRVPGRHKGHVADTIRAEMPDAALAYLGDDLTDEDAFRAVAGDGLGVLVRGDFRDTAAGLWLRPPHELLEFLERWTAVRAGRHIAAGHSAGGDP